MTDQARLDQLTVNTIRTLAMDAVQAANSGHPGTPMALAPVAYCLWQRFLRFDPDDPIWPNRDRFVLSAGHASMLIYSLLHLAGVKAVNPEYERLGELSVKLDDIKRFRQLDSRCAGHPEYRWTSGIETTTGPLGAGVATSVGMAIAGRWQAKHFNQPGFDMFDYDVYSIAGDGCMMEGISGEAASLAGHLKLSNLCWIYDNNKITIEGHTEWAFSEDVATRFIAYGWNVLRVGDANDLEMLERAFNTFKKEQERPTLIIVDSHIAWGSPNKQDTHAAHGEPLARTRSSSQAQLRLAGGRQVPGARRRARALRRRHGARGRSAGQVDGPVRAVSRQARRPGRSAHPYAAPQPPQGWDKNLTAIPPIPRARRAATSPARSSTRSRRTCRTCSAARPTSRPRRRHGSRSRAPVTSRRTTTAGGTSTSASASTPWAPS
jgi:transketolase